MPPSTVTVWATNTGVGKTLVSAGLAAVARRGPLYRNVLYIKPVQTGYPDDSDGAHVANVGGGTYEAMPHAAAAGMVSKPPASIPREGGGLLCRTIFAWKRAVGPHLAAASEGRAVSDDELVAAVRDAAGWARSDRALALVETAGGVASPAPSGTLQHDVYASLGLPALLVGDGALGGISATLCAHEALARRGHAVAAVALLDGGLRNEEAIRDNLPAETPVVVLPPIRPEDTAADWVHGAAEGPLRELLHCVAPEESSRSAS